VDYLFSSLEKLNEFKTVEQGVKNGRLPLSVTGLSLLHKVHFSASLCKKLGKKALFITADESEANKLIDNLKGLSFNPFFYEAREFTFRNIENKSHEYEHSRLTALYKMLSGDYDIIVACVDAVLQLVPDKKSLLSHCFVIEEGQTFSQENLIESLVKNGFSRAQQVEGAGQFSVRGGILDIFKTDGKAVRVDLWGDEIDTISYFDPLTQRRTERVKKITITPVREVLASDGLIKNIEAFAKKIVGKHAKEIKEQISSDLEMLKNGLHLASIDKYISLIYEKTTLFDFLDNTLLFVSEMTAVKERIRSYTWQQNEDIKALLSEHVISGGLASYSIDFTDFCRNLEEHNAIYFDTFARGFYDTKIYQSVTVSAKKLSPITSFSALSEELYYYKENKYKVIILSANAKTAGNLLDSLTEKGFTAVIEDNNSVTDANAPDIIISKGGLNGGFSYSDIKLAVIAFGSMSASATQKPKAQKKRKGEEIRSLSELSVGDYVVHNTHGFGIFEGIHNMPIQGIIKDYIKIKYAKNDVLYVPVTQLDLVSKYIGPRDDIHLKLHTLGGNDWQKTKTRVKGAIKDIAKELIRLYSARMKQKGFAFFEDDDMQNSFERRFEYDETDDQLRCADEIKQDMQRSVPMDRLLCGDVGFGKTEVALRAAFKCVSGNKQCALLVPTTILAWQHYQTIVKRMEGFPVRVELLSRFRTAKQQTQIIKELAKGNIDIIVGTHRLVSKDVHFKDLGLVIIDEEQRFGVAQKERLKEAFQAVDVLTLSATPIPRTMNMALSGIRDMSVIEEAPSDRHPVETYVLEHDNGIVCDAIKREMRRGGQCYYLHNRVETISTAAARIQAGVPDARIGIAHGKMNEEELSEIWRMLLEQEIDVLVCTTIIETGVDVPNVNTLIIENADKMGLSQLHQLRGRVGRSSKRAYAYLTFMRGKILSDISQKRLEAIREFTEFGSGFKISMRDMEIRGAGNVLGGEQSGHMEQVGYDLYLKLLSDAVLEEKGEITPKKDAECLIDLQLDAHIPEEYIESLSQRLDMYKRIANICDEEDVSDVLDEFIDRFGEPPKAVTGLIDIALIRNLAKSCDIYEISQKNSTFLMYVKAIDMKRVSGLVNMYKGRVMLNAGSKPYVSVKCSAKMSATDDLTDILKSFSTIESD